ncbi:MAG TPA: DUF4190 domain-containing protein [Pyrinomonadaceae bacterium]|nr:DUF4190 domain-containing protein [Pyrinomonadaceae bacterium]
MKKCPNCERTFDDAMRFCQADGTPLVEDPPAVDPYKTMVASSEEIASAIPSSPTSESQPADAANSHDEVLQLPSEPDPKKTMYVSEEEIRKEMDAHDEPVMELPPLAPEPPRFKEPSVEPPKFDDPPPSPFSRSDNEPISSPSDDHAFNRTTPPIPSPFDKPKPAVFESAPVRDPDPEPQVSEEPAFSPAFSAGPEPSPAFGPADPAPIQNWEPNEPMQNAPMSAAPQGPNQTLAIISLVAGILGLTVCCGSLLPSLAAVVLGFMARGKANSDPANYGGSGLALGGIITGALGLLAGIIVLALYFLGFAATMMQGVR